MVAHTHTHMFVYRHSSVLLAGDVDMWQIPYILHSIVVASFVIRTVD